MITFAAITPHPPIIIPEIGDAASLKKAQKTIAAMEMLRDKLEKANPETLIIISPHAEMEGSRFVINSNPILRGSFVDFGYDKVFDFKNDLEAVNRIAYFNDIDSIPTHLHEEGFLDHGALVPLYYLTKNIQPKIVHLAFSMLDAQTHYRFGQNLGKMCCEDKKIAIVASGDFSHRLTPEAPAGYSPRGKEFDEALIDYLKKAKTKDILNLDENLVEEAGQCGLRSVVILLGALEGKYTFDLLSYEGPFGVGYMVASLQ
jgi:MEMO1 family protein